MILKKTAPYLSSMCITCVATKLLKILILPQCWNGLLPTKKQSSIMKANKLSYLLNWRKCNVH